MDWRNRPHWVCELDNACAELTFGKSVPLEMRCGDKAFEKIVAAKKISPKSCFYDAQGRVLWNCLMGGIPIVNDSSLPAWEARMENLEFGERVVVVGCD
jgi:hypothetical protein